MQITDIPLLGAVIVLISRTRQVVCSDYFLPITSLSTHPTLDYDNHSNIIYWIPSFLAAETSRSALLSNWWLISTWLVGGAILRQCFILLQDKSRLVYYMRSDLLRHHGNAVEENLTQAEDRIKPY